MTKMKFDPLIKDKRCKERRHMAHTCSDFDTVALGATSKGQISHSVVKNGKRKHKLPQ